MWNDEKELSKDCDLNVFYFNFVWYFATGDWFGLSKKST